MSDLSETHTQNIGARWLLGGTAVCFVGAGLLLWVREGERLFTDGLIAAIARCF